MELFSIIMLSLAVSMDGFWSGLAYGLGRIRATQFALVLIGLISFLGSLGAILVGSMLMGFVPEWATNLVGAVLFIFIGIRAFLMVRKPQEIIKGKKQVSNMSLVDSLLVGTVVAIDASIAALAVGVMGWNTLWTPLAFGFAHYLLVWLGNYVGLFKLVTKERRPLAYLPGVIFVFLGFLRLF